MGRYLLQGEYRNHPIIKELHLEKYPYDTRMIVEVFEKIEEGGDVEDIVILLNNHDMNKCDKCFWWCSSEQLYWEGYDFNEDWEDDHEYETLCNYCFKEIIGS